MATAPPPTTGAAPDARVMLGVFIAVASVSAAAIFIRLADAPALAIATWRNVFAVGLLLPVVLVRREAFPRGRTLLLALGAGVALALHFALWISSLEHTTVAASVVLVCTQPMFVALLSWVLLNERASALTTVGTSVAFLGTALIAADDSIAGSAPFGNMLALGGALTVAVYVLIGRRVRAGGVALLPYAVVVYGTAGVLLLMTTLLAGIPLTGFSASTWLWLALIAIFPQILGHTLFNWALRYVKAPVLSGTILAEPVVSTALAWMILDEVPGARTLLGGGVVLVGLYLLLRGRE